MRLRGAAAGRRSVLRHYSLHPLRRTRRVGCGAAPQHQAGSAPRAGAIAACEPPKTADHAAVADPAAHARLRRTAPTMIPMAVATQGFASPIVTAARAAPISSVGVARRSGAINTVNAPFNCALPRMARASLSAARCARCTLPQTCGWVQTRRSVWGSRPIAVLSKVAPQFPLTPGPAPRTGAGSAASQLGCAVRRSRAGTLAGMSVFPGELASSV